MTLIVSPDVGVPLKQENADTTLCARVAAAAATAELLMEHGLDLTIGQSDIDAANELAHSFAENPTAATKKFASPKALSRMTPASLVLTRDVLHQYGRAVVESSLQIRHMVTNKLIIETENPDPRVRIRALELLGKISDVGLFTERSEVLITHQSTDDLRQKLREKLLKVRDGSLFGGVEHHKSSIEDASIVSDVPAAAVYSDIREELGLECS